MTRSQTAVCFLLACLGMSSAGDAKTISLSFFQDTDFLNPSVAYNDSMPVISIVGDPVLRTRGLGHNDSVNLSVGDTINANILFNHPVYIPASVNFSEIAASLAVNLPFANDSSYVQFSSATFGASLFGKSVAFPTNYRVLCRGGCYSEGLSQSAGTYASTQTIDAFRFNEISEKLTIGNIGVRPHEFSNITVPISGLYYANFIPKSTAGIIGGSAASPAKLSISGPISLINSNIPSGQSQEFFEFHWNGGYFESAVSIKFPSSLPSNESSYHVELARIGYGSIPVLATPTPGFPIYLGEEADALTAANSFTETIAAAGSPSTGYYDLCNLSFPPDGGCNLAAGNYEIGIVGNTSVDPELTIDFASPVKAPVANVPESDSLWPLLCSLGLISIVRGRKRTN